MADTNDLNNGVHKRVCPLCEAMCGVKIKVKDGNVINVAADKDNVWSRGHVCPKGIMLDAIHNDPDRVRTPMIREGIQWHEVNWDQAFKHIEKNVADIRNKYGQQSFGFYGGNMSGKGFASSRYMMLMLTEGKFAQRFSSSTVDQIPKNLSSHLLYGNMWKIPVPDIDNTELFVIIGANPAASMGSLLAHNDVMKGIRELRARGGKVIVIDPVKTRTAELSDQWIPIRPGSDSALLLAIAHVIFKENRVNLAHLSELVNGLEILQDLTSRFAPEKVAKFCRISAEDIRTLAIQIADADKAAIYGRIGTCTQEFGTLASWLVDAISIITGNMDKLGGSMWSNQVAPHLDMAPPYPSDAPIVSPSNRVRGVPGILGQYPASCLAEEIDTPGEGQIKGLLTLGANPVLSAPGPERLNPALASLEFMVSMDIYINETTRHADVILPSPSLLEQPHWDVWAWPWCLTSGGHYSPTTIMPEDRPEEWQVMARLGAIFGGNPAADLNALDDDFFSGMCDQLGVDKELAFAALPQQGPERILDFCIRTGPFGDGFGQNPEGLTLASFKQKPDGLLLGHAKPQGKKAITTPSGKIELAHEHLLKDIPRLEEKISNPGNELLLVSRRHIGSMNSWMHNIEKLVKGKDRCTLQIHPTDAAKQHIKQGQLIAISNESGAITAHAEITKNICPGIVCLPHGWGHSEKAAKLSVASKHPGFNINKLSPATLVDEASGNAVLNGIPVTLDHALQAN
jgi:anaerobic selenocysteine-containing dehydrogenase